MVNHYLHFMAVSQALVLGLVVSCTCACADSFNLITFNADLTPPTDYEVRRSILLDQLAVSEADIVCLQGIHSEMDIRNIVSVMSSIGAFPHSWSFLHYAETSTLDPTSSAESAPYNPCPYEDVVEFCGCVDSNCREAAADGRAAYFECIFRECSPMKQFPPRCMECVVDRCFNPADLGATFGCMLNATASDNQYCSTFLTDSKRRISSTKGLLMLSKHPLKELSRDTILPARSVMPVGYLRAEVTGLGGFVCAHLTGFLGEPFLDYETGFDSYEAENLFETYTLLAQQNNIIMGDLNFSPFVLAGNISDRFVASYDAAQRLGFTSVNNVLGQCTVCADNPLAEYLLTRDGENFMYDHILLRDESPLEVLNVEIGTYGLWSYVGNNSPASMSSHYSVSATLTRT